MALIVEILCITFIGASLGELDTGHFFLVLDPATFRRCDAFGAELEELLARMRAVVPVDPEMPVLIPGDPEHDAAERRRRDGIPMVPTLVEEVRTVCEESGAAFLLAPDHSSR